MRPLFSTAAHLALLLVLALPAAAQEAAAPTGFGALGGALTVGTDGPPEAMIAYPLATWPSFFKHGFGDIVGLVGSEGLALGLGHRFPEYETAGNVKLTLTLGPAYYVPVGEDTHGLSDGELRLFVSVSIKLRVPEVPPAPAPEPAPEATPTPEPE